MRTGLYSTRNLLTLMCCLAFFVACNLARPASPTPQPSATPALPQIQILSPPHNQRVIDGVIFDIDILASDASVGIQRIELVVDELLLQSSESPSGRERDFRVTMNWFAKSIGWHKFSAIAYREDGTASHPHIIALEVIPPG